MAELPTHAWLLIAAIGLILVVGVLHVLATRLADAFALHDLKVRVAEIQQEQMRKAQGQPPQQTSPPETAQPPAGQIKPAEQPPQADAASEQPQRQAA